MSEWEKAKLAIYHFHLQTISRSQGRSSIAASAYRSGEILKDERTGEVQDYSRRSGVFYAEVILPDGGSAQRQDLWNAVESAEKRKNSTVAREIVVALPHELAEKERNDLIMGYALELSKRTGWGVDVAVHAPGREGDIRNIHAHLLCTTRTIERDEDGVLNLGAKTREWDAAKTGSALVKQERQEWEKAVNQALEKAGEKARVDSRSHAEKETGLIPQVHLGPQISAMERQGIQTDVGDLSREIAAHNAQVIQLDAVRAKQQEENAWKQNLQKMNSLPLEEHRKAVSGLQPPSFEAMLSRQPEMDVLLHQTEEPRYYSGNQYGKGGQWSLNQRRELEKDCTQEERELTSLKREETSFRKQHPYYSKLHDWGLPLCEQPALTSYQKEIEEKEQVVVKTRESLKDFDQTRAGLLGQIDELKKQMGPKMQEEHSRMCERYEEAKALYLEREKWERLLVKEKEKEQDRGWGMSR